MLNLYVVYAIFIMLQKPKLYALNCVRSKTSVGLEYNNLIVYKLHFNMYCLWDTNIFCSHFHAVYILSIFYSKYPIDFFSHAVN